MADKFTDDDLIQGAKNAQTLSKRIGDACADHIDANKDRDPVIVFGEVMAGIMTAAASIQASTKRDPKLIGEEFELGVRVAAMISPTHVLGERLRDAVKDLAIRKGENDKHTDTLPTGEEWN